jgi:hypothetical protein
MTRTRFAALSCIALGALLFLTTAQQRTALACADNPEELAVRDVITKAYFHGAFNDQDTAAMARGFHKDFAIFSARGEELSRYEIGEWIDGIKKRRASADFDPASSAYDGKIISLDVTGGAACAKVELRKDDKLVYTDYLSLLRFDSGWKISAKVYHKH